MPEMNRRTFLIASAGAVGLAGTAAVTLPQLLEAGRQRPLPEASGILVIVTLYGGNDGLNTVIPYTANAYHDARPELSYAPSEVLDLDGTYGLNPALAGLSESWHRNELAIIRGVGYPNQDRSHFRSMDIWQTASPAAPVNTGWIGRWLDAGGNDPLRAVNIGTVLPPMAIGVRQTAAALSDQVPSVPRDHVRTLSALGAVDPADTPAMAGVRESYRAYSQVDAAFRPLTSASSPQVIDDPGKRFAADLNLVADCIHANVPTQVYMVQLMGFDTHADERGTHQDLLQKLDAALAPFLRNMDTQVRGSKVVVMVYSEFGRRVAANASQGTDHGTSGPVFVVGKSVKGGFYGDQPSLTDLADGDLKTTTDFRDVYSSLMSHTLGTDPAPSVGAGRRELGFV